MISGEDLLQLMDELQAGKLLVMNNGPVYALLGDANNPDLLENIKAVKDSSDGKDNRRSDQPVGWTVPFDSAVDTIDATGITEPRVRELLESPDRLTRRLGAIAFVRAKADMDVKAWRKIPDSIIPDRKEATVQIWSPTGRDIASRIIRTAQAFDVEPIMTSANVSSTREIINEADARAFVARHHGRLHFVETAGEEDGTIPPFGSYPIVGVAEDRFTLEREGCFHAELLEALLDDVPFQPVTAEGLPPKPANYPEGSFGLEDLPVRYQNLRGHKLWLGIVSYLGWHDDLLDLPHRRLHRLAGAAV